MESRLSFRLADPSDAEFLGRLNFQLIRDEDHRNPMSEPELADRVRGWLRSEEYQAAIFFLEADLIAYVLWRKEGVGQVGARISDMICRLAPLFPGDLLAAIYHLRF